MTTRIGIRSLLIASAAAGLFLAAGHTPAQAPPARDPDQRLRALEEKMDQVLQRLQGRAEVVPVTLESTKGMIDMLSTARETLSDRVEKQTQALLELRQKSPYVLFRGSATNLYAERLAKDEAVLQDLERRQAELAARTALVKSVGDAEAEARALLVLLQRRGVDVDGLRRTAAAGRDVGPIELVRLYAASLRLESDELQQLARAAEERLERDRTMVRELSKYETEEEKLRSDLEQSREILRGIAKQLQTMNLIRSVKP